MMKIGEPFNPYRLFHGVFIPNSLLKYKGISHGAKLCYGRLSQYAGENGYAYPSYKTLANELGMSKRTAIRYCIELEQEGLIEIVLRKNKKNNFTSNIFRFLWHKLFEMEIEPGDNIDTTPGDNPDTTLVTDLSPKEIHIIDSKKNKKHTGENHAALMKDTYLSVIHRINSGYWVEDDREGYVTMRDLYLGHLGKESKRKKKLQEKFGNKDIPSLVKKWDTEKGVMKEKGMKPYDSPKNSNSILSYYKENFKDTFGQIPPLELGKDRALIKKMIDHYGYDYTLDMFEWVFNHWSVFVREKNIKGLPTVGLIFGFRAYIQSKVIPQEQTDDGSEW